MTAVLAREVEAVQNPALGAAILWRFTVGYTSSGRPPAAPTLPVLFLPLPIVFHEETFALLAATQKRSGVRGFAAKFGDSAVAEGDVLLALDRRAKLLRGLTLSSLRLALASRLLFLLPDSAAITSTSSTMPSSIREAVRPLLKNAEKLGNWFGDVTLFELSELLHVRF